MTTPSSALPFTPLELRGFPNGRTVWRLGSAELLPLEELELQQPAAPPLLGYFQGGANLGNPPILMAGLEGGAPLRVMPLAQGSLLRRTGRRLTPSPARIEATREAAANLEEARPTQRWAPPAGRED